MCALFVVTGARKIVPVLGKSSMRVPSAFDSTDRYIEVLTGTQDGSKRMLDALEGAPRNKPIALFLPDGSKQAAFVHQIVVYLGWPREVQWIPANDEMAERKLREIAPASLAAVIFWGVKPPDWLPAGVRLGPEQVIVPLPEKSNP